MLTFPSRKTSKSAKDYPFAVLAQGSGGLPYLHSLHKSLASAQRQAIAVPGSEVVTREEAESIGVGAWR